MGSVNNKHGERFGADSKGHYERFLAQLLGLTLGENLRLYLDVETYRPRKEDAFVRETVIAIGVIEDWTPYCTESAKIWKEPDIAYRFFTLWEIDGKNINDKEKKLIIEFYEYLRKFVDDYRAGHIRFLNIVGFNILRYDIPLLVQKGIEYGVASAAELNCSMAQHIHNRLFPNIVTIPRYAVQGFEARITS